MTIRQTFKLGTQWPTLDPFLFCAHHDDLYPAGNADLGPDASLDGHRIGQDFENPQGWNMYHGSKVPGFPQHPHRGFETISYLRDGVMDHADSLGATARFGKGDVQWMTTGSGIQHSEMFPLLNADAPNPMHLFQIWLNLPARDKMVDPYFTMMWSEDMTRIRRVDEDGNATEVTIIAGQIGESVGMKPPINSWAADPRSDLAIWHVKLDAGASWLMPPARVDEGPIADRVLYLYREGGIELAPQGQAPTDVESLAGGSGAVLAADQEVLVTAPGDDVEFVILQGRSIGEPVAQHGPFVMNTDAEINQAIADYRQTQFGGWPWPNPAPDHGATTGRFAKHPDGRYEGAPDDVDAR